MGLAHGRQQNASRKSRLEIQKNTARFFETILKAEPLKRSAVRLLTSHLKNHTSKTNKTFGTLLEKQG